MAYGLKACSCHPYWSVLILFEFNTRPIFFMSPNRCNKWSPWQWHGPQKTDIYCDLYGEAVREYDPP